MQTLISEFIPELSFPERLRMRRQGRNFWAAYMSTRERALDTAMAVIRQRLGMEAPYFKVGVLDGLLKIVTKVESAMFFLNLKDIRTKNATDPQGSYFLPKSSHKWRQSSSQVKKMH